LKVTLGQLYQVLLVLKKISNFDLPVKKAWKLFELQSFIKDKLKGFDAERVKLLQKYGVNVINNSLSISNEKREAFAKDLEELFNIEIDIDVPIFLEIEELEGVKLSIADFEILSLFCKKEV
jgi:hypothetical protein